VTPIKFSIHKIEAKKIKLYTLWILLEIFLALTPPKQIINLIEIK